MNFSSKKFNRLINEKSPYLLQHAYNPVDWFPWSEEAFEKAMREDKPIFLSIGYSTCHWCHVMEKESFEDEEVAKLMNEVFISIKVDREERPDIDNIYMLVCQMTTGSGGWPLSIIMTPEKKPFFCGTYFPKESAYGRIGFKDLITNVDYAWKNKRTEIFAGVNQIEEYLSQIQSSPSKVEPSTNHLRTAFENYEQRYDQIHGGFGSAPKFPSPHNLMFLLRYWKRTGEQKALEMVSNTLTEMRKGGIYDHVGFGFHRYSTDSRWLVPHFEKMLYDQALLIIAYTEAYQATRNPEFKRTAEEIIEYVLREMTSPAGAFYSAEDADSEGEEGKYYVWTKRELVNCLGTDDAEFASKIFNVNTGGNFGNEAHGQFEGINIFHLTKTKTDLATSFGMTTEDFQTRLDSIRSKLFKERNKRVHPYKDDKILCDWNGLMIAALSIAGRTFANHHFISAAEKAAAFIKLNLTDNTNKLIHRYRDNSAGLTANINDYSFLIWGLFELHQTTFSTTYLDEATRLAEITIKHFWDDAAGGFFFSPDYGEKLLIRTKEIYDGAIPSGNSVMLLNMIKLSRLTGNITYNQYATQLVDSFSEIISRSPAASSYLLTGLEYLFGNSFEIAITNRTHDEETKYIIEKLDAEFIPNKVILLYSLDENKSGEDLFPQINSKPTIYLCRNYSCDMPTNDVHAVLKRLEEKESTL